MQMNRSADPRNADIVESWVQRGIATWPRGEYQGELHAAALAEKLRLAGASSLQDFKELTSSEAQAVWLPFAELPSVFVDHLLHILPQMLRVQTKKDTLVHENVRNPASAGPARERTPPRMLNTPGVPTLIWGMGVLRKSRAAQFPPPPDEFAEVIRRLGEVPPAAMQARWQAAAVSLPPELPRARATWLAGLPLEKRREIQVVLEEDVVWKIMASWRTSAAQYASAVQLWGFAAAIAGTPAWPPSRQVLDTFCFFFKHCPTLSR